MKVRHSELKSLRESEFSGASNQSLSTWPLALEPLAKTGHLGVHKGEHTDSPGLADKAARMETTRAVSAFEL